MRNYSISLDDGRISNPSVTKDHAADTKYRIAADLLNARTGIPSHHDFSIITC